jgi:hypothetical protein
VTIPNALTTADVMMCPHGGTVTLASSNARTSAGGGFVLRPGDTFTIAGCAFSTPLGPHPCVTVAWSAPATARAAGDAILTQSSVGLCKAADQAVQGAVLIQKTQVKVSLS